MLGRKTFYGLDIGQSNPAEIILQFVELQACTRVIDCSDNSSLLEHSSRVVRSNCTTPSLTAPISAPFFYPK